MELSSPSPVLALAAGEVVTLDDARGVRIQAGAGSVWVTEEADFQDHILEPGEALVVAHDGRTIIQAMQPSWVALRDAAAANDPLDASAPRSAALELLRARDIAEEHLREIRLRSLRYY